MVRYLLIFVVGSSLCFGMSGCATDGSGGGSGTRSRGGSSSKNEMLDSSRDSFLSDQSESGDNNLTHVAYYEPAEAEHRGEKKALKVLGVNDDIFAMVRKSKGVVLIDFYADWCGPCQRQSGILEKLEPVAAKNKACIIKVNVDQHPQLADRFDVTGLPTLMLVKDGMIVKRQMGVADSENLTRLLSR